MNSVTQHVEWLTFTYIFMIRLPSNVETQFLLDGAKQTIITKWISTIMAFYWIELAPNKWECFAFQMDKVDTSNERKFRLIILALSSSIQRECLYSAKHCASHKLKKGSTNKMLAISYAIAGVFLFHFFRMRATARLITFNSFQF